jgi:hypothetical protein
MSSRFKNRSCLKLHFDCRQLSSKVTELQGISGEMKVQLRQWEATSTAAQKLADNLKQQLHEAHQIVTDK